MESIRSSSEFPKLTSDISIKNADFLAELSNESSLTITEHVRRAAALYQLSMGVYEDGGGVYAVSGQEREVIPLFDLEQQDEESPVAVSLSVNLNTETAKLFQDLGIGAISGKTRVLDNIINHYLQAVQKSLSDHKIIVEYSNNTQHELFFL